MTNPVAPIPVLYEDNHLIVVMKPAGLATMGGTGQRDSAINQVKQYLKEEYNKPGNVYLGIVSRLDAMVSGVLVFARTSKAAARLSRQFADGKVDKVYWAIVERTPRPTSSELCDWLRKDERLRRMVVAIPGDQGAKHARLRYRVLQRLGQRAVLEIHLETGRKHQIRVQLAHQHCAVLGDSKYGASSKFPRGIALHARTLAFEHPVRRTRVEFTAPLPPCWRDYGVDAD